MRNRSSFKNALAIVFGIVSISIATGCAGGRNPDKEAADQIPSHQQISGTKVYIKDGSLAFDSNQVHGTGTALFTSQLPDGGHNFQLAFSLQDGGQVELFTFADNSLRNGVQIKFTRNGSGPGSLKAEISANGNTIDISAVHAHGGSTVSISDLDASVPLMFSMDVHNDESPAHVIIWEGLEPDAHDEPLYSSEEDETVPGKGRGKNWGLRLKDAIVNVAQFADPRDDHH